MSEAEFIEVINLHATSAMNAFAIYLSLTFAFLTAIYIVGAKLSKIQALMVIGLYLVWSTAFACVAIVHLLAFDSLIHEYSAFVRTRMFYLPWPEFGVITTAAGILISGYFVLDIRGQIGSVEKIGNG